MAISDACDRTYTAKHQSGTRPLSAIRLVVIHDTEGGSAKGIAHYFANPPNKDVGSTHLVIDDVSCYRTLADNVIPWAAPPCNTNGFHIELCGYAKWTALIWASHRAMLNRAAYKTALHCKKFGIPPYYIGASDLKAGKTGVTTHAQITKAFHVSDHSDPGAFWPRWWFMRRVRAYYKDG